jgi:hypothetical protein
MRDPSSRFARACDALEGALSGPLRTALVETAVRQSNMANALGVVRDGMRSHGWRTREHEVDLGAITGELDNATRAEGFHVLHDWDGKAERVTPNSIAQDVLDLVAEQRGDEPPVREVAAILLDLYFLYVLALVAMRSWDTDAPGAALDRVSGLLHKLQGPQGSGQRFAENAETLLLIATSHYEPNESGYDRMLTRARELPASNRTAMALTHAQAMGGHLRFGYEVTYGKDLKAMRDDNGADYPWLCFGLAGLMDEYERTMGADPESLDRARVIEGLINGLTPDPDAFLARPPASLAPHLAEYSRFQEAFGRHQADLLSAFETHRPRDRGFWPLAVFFNFSQNVLKGLVVHSLLKGQPGRIGLNDLFTGMPRTEVVEAEKLAVSRTLMAYARINPDTIRGRLSPVIVYDPVVGRQYFGGAMRAIKRRI